MQKNLLYFFLFFVCIMSTAALSAQYKYKLANDILFFDQNDTIEAPLLGGFNSPTFAAIDINLDGKEDLLVLEIFGDILYPFINVGDSGETKYRYDPSYREILPKDLEGYISTADFNCDGKPDLFYTNNNNVKVYENLSTSNKFQLGNSRQITFLNRNYQEKLNLNRIYKPAFADIDGDGDIDILYPLNDQVAYLKNLSMERTSQCGLDFEIRAKCWGLFTEQNATSIIFLDTCEMGKDPVNERTKGNKHAGGTILAFDIDGNGTMDLLFGDVSQKHLTLLINGDNTPNRVSSHIISKDESFPAYDKPIHVNNSPAAYYMDLDNDGLKDLIIAPFNSDPVEPAWTDRLVHVYKNVGNSVRDSFHFVQDDFLFEKMIDLGRGAHPVLYDVSGDGLLDIVAGNMGRYDSLTNQFIGSLTYFKNVGTATKPEFELIDEDFAGVSKIKLQGGYFAMSLYPAIADLDNDGKVEMLLGDDYGKMHLFRDSSTTAGAPDFKLVKKYYNNIGLESNRASTPTFYDLNKDGLMDLIIGHDNGTMDFYPNWGSPTEPVFTFEVDSIIFQRDSVVRYYIPQKYNISRLKIGEIIKVMGSQPFQNSGKKEILVIDTVDHYLDLLSIYSSDSSHRNESSTDKLIFYGIENMGGINFSQPNTANGLPTPFFYEYKNETKMISGSKEGEIYYFDGIDGNLDSSFTLQDSNYFKYDFGRFAYASGGDLNADGETDLIIGNLAGGFQIFYADGVVGLDEYGKTEAISFDLFPNPSTGEITIDLKDQFTFQDLHLSVYDIMGKEIKSTKVRQARINLSLHDLPSGMYFVKIYDRNISMVKKAIIRH